MNPPTVTKQQLNDAVRALARKNRPAAVAILARFDVLTAAVLPPEHWQAVHDTCMEALAKLNASVSK
jgi:hypothetical protein